MIEVSPAMDAVLKRHERASETALPLIYFDQLDDELMGKNWLIKNVIARNEISSWIGPPGGAKSALLTDLAVHVAAGRSWRGHRTTSAFGAIYFALERAELVRRRLIAYRQRDALPATTPIAVCSRLINLMDPRSVEIIAATIKAAEDHFGHAAGLAIIDTFNKGIAAGGGDEDKARDQNVVNANMRRILELAHIHIAGVGHTGKDEKRGERGSNARLADVDLLVRISGNGNRIASVEKANDQAASQLTAFALEQIELGQDEDGDPITTAIVGTDVVPVIAKGRPRGSGAARIALDLLERALIDAGHLPPASNNIPAGVRTINLALWREYCDRGMIASSDKSDTKARAFNRAAERLQVLGLIGVWAGQVWMTKPSGQKGQDQTKTLFCPRDP